MQKIQEKEFKKGDRVRILSLSEISSLGIISRQVTGHHVLYRGDRHKGGISVEMLEFLGHSFIINDSHQSDNGMYTLCMDDKSPDNCGEIAGWTWYAEILEHIPVTKNYNGIRKILEVTNTVDDLKLMEEI